MTEKTSTDTNLVITRTLNAPREAVFKAWTEAEALAQWWGPKGMPIEVLHLDVRPGGTFHYSMGLPDGSKWYGIFHYREVSPPDRLVWVNSFADASGNIVRPPFSTDFPLEILNSIVFTEEDGVTTLTLTGGPINPTENELAIYAGMHASMQAGFGGTLDQLEAYLAPAS